MLGGPATLTSFNLGSQHVSSGGPAAVTYISARSNCLLEGDIIPFSSIHVVKASSTWIIAPCTQNDQLPLEERLLYDDSLEWNFIPVLDMSKVNWSKISSNLSNYKRWPYTRDSFDPIWSKSFMFFFLVRTTLQNIVFILPLFSYISNTWPSAMVFIFLPCFSFAFKVTGLHNFLRAFLLGLLGAIFAFHFYTYSVQHSKVRLNQHLHSFIPFTYKRRSIQLSAFFLHPTVKTLSGEDSEVALTATLACLFFF